MIQLPAYVVVHRVLNFLIWGWTIIFWEGKIGFGSNIESYEGKNVHYIVNGFNLKTVKDNDIGSSDSYIVCDGQYMEHI